MTEFTSAHPEVDRIFEFYQDQWIVWSSINHPQFQNLLSLDDMSVNKAYWVHSSIFTQSFIVSQHTGDTYKDDIQIRYSLNDLKASNVQLLLQYSLNGGLSYQQSPSISGDILNVVNNSSGTLTWHSGSDIQTNEDNVIIKILASYNNKQYEALFSPIQIQNFQGTNFSSGPNVQSVSPTPNSSNVSSKPLITIVFKEDLDQASILNNIRLIHNDKLVNTSMSYDNKTVSLQVLTELSYNSDYRIQLDTGLMDYQLQPLEQRLIYHFKVKSYDGFSEIPMIPAEQWDQAAVRKVLHTFSFGGFASDSQIEEWAKMTPIQASEEILRMDPINTRLSPADDYDGLDKRAQSLQSLSAFLQTEFGPIKSTNRSYYQTTNWNGPENLFLIAATKRGLNPFFHRIGLMETNYHMAVNQNVGVSTKQLISYYDDVMVQHQAAQPYQDVLGHMAASPAIAVQYNHRRNRFNGTFSGNEDFAREFHQLFFGILGKEDQQFATYPSYPSYQDDYQKYHENVTIRNTARALTDMEVDGDNYSIRYGESNHHTSSLEIIGQSVNGNQAYEKLLNLARQAIHHEESEKNLPLLIIRHLADDNMDQETQNTIVEAWKKMDEKSLIQFLRNYAVSTLFHNSKRVKYWTSFERNIMINNLSNLNNLSNYDRGAIISSNLSNEDVSVFRPSHDVFGGQTSIEAASSGAIFQAAHDYNVSRTWSSLRVHGEYNNQNWTQDWSKVIPRRDDGRYYVKDVAEWLWNRYVADNLKNFGELERAQVYAFLATGDDFSRAVNIENTNVVYSLDEIRNNDLVHQIYTDLSNSTMNTLGNPALPFNCESRCSSDEEQETDNRRIQLAVNFISITPFMFVQEGR
ncbi:MAG: DUF1800 family protein [Candidatus Cloacimonetes bacterium]|nr:DUF1800 family protein [Candidatus Cloacimonadota bacterium]